MTPLERRYRRALRWFPAGWRVAVLDTLLERAADEGRTEPRDGELADLTRSGLAARGRAVVGRVPAASRRLLGSAAIGAGAVYSLFALLSTELPPRDWTPESGGLSEQPWMLGPFMTPAALAFLLWIAAFLALLLRWRRLGVWLLTASAGWSIAIYPVLGARYTVRISEPTEYWNGLMSLLPSGLSFLFLTLLALFALGDGARLSSRRAGFVGVGVMAAVIGFVALSIAVNTTLGTMTDAILWGDQPALAVVVLLLVATGTLIGIGGRRALGIAVAFGSLPLAITMVAQIIDQHGLQLSGGGLIVFAVAQIVAAGTAAALTLGRRPFAPR